MSLQHVFCISAGRERPHGEGGLGESYSDSSGRAAWRFGQCASCLDTLLLWVKLSLNFRAVGGCAGSVGKKYYTLVTA